jgi:hypothetical protein
MKRVIAATAYALFVLFAPAASAEPIDISDVGGKDLLIGGYDVGNSDQAEQDFLFTYLESMGLGYSLSDLSYQKIDVEGPDSFVEVVGEEAGRDFWAIDFTNFALSSPVLFLVTFGNAEHDQYLYENVQSLQYGVVDLADFAATRGRITISSISHTSAVPEPATLSLLVAGIASLGVASRKRRRRLA